MATVMMHARELQEKAILDRENSIGVQIDALKIQTLELETEAAEQRYKTLRRKADQVKLHWTEQTIGDERMAEKITLQGPGRSNPVLNEIYVSETPWDLRIDPKAGNPNIPFSDWKNNDRFEEIDNAVLVNRNEKMPLENLDNLTDELRQGKKDDVLSTGWLKLENMLQCIATEQDELAHSPASSNTQDSHGVKVGDQYHDSEEPFLPLSKEQSSLRSHQASDRRKGGSINTSRSEPSSNNDGGCSSASERDYETEPTAKQQATGGIGSKTNHSEPDLIASYHHEREAESLDPYSLGLDLPLDENHTSSVYRVERPETSELLSNGSQGLHWNGSDRLSMESNGLATPILAANAQHPKLSGKYNDFRKSGCSSDGEPDNEDWIASSRELPTAQSVQRRPKIYNGEAGDSLAKVHRAHKDEDIEHFETGEHQPFPKSTSKDVSDGTESDEYSINRFRVPDDAFDTNDTYPSHNPPHAIQESDSKLTESQSQASNSLKSEVSKATTASQDAERNKMNELQVEVTGAESLKLSVVWNREPDEACKAPSPAIPSTIPGQSPPTMPSPDRSVHSLNPTPKHIGHEPDESKTPNDKPANQEFRSTGYFPPGTNAVSHQDWSICDLGNPSALSYPNGWICKFRPDFLPSLTAWNLLRLSSDSNEARSWFRVNRMMMHVDVEEIRHVIGKQRAKRKNLLDRFAKLSDYQQQQITRLLEDLETLDYPKSTTWTFTLQALLTQPKSKGGKDTKSIQVFVERRLQPGSTPSHMATEVPNGYPLKYSTTQYPPNLDSSAPADPRPDPPPAPTTSYMQPGHSHNSDPGTNTQPQRHAPSTSDWTNASKSTSAQPKHYTSSRPAWTGTNTTTRPQQPMPSTSSLTGTSTKIQPQHPTSSTSAWSDPKLNTTNNANDVSAGSRTDKKKQTRKEPRYRSGKESTVRFAPFPRTDHGHGGSTRESSREPSSHSQRRTPDNESRNIKGSSSLSSISEEYHNDSKSSARRENYAQKSQKENDKAAPEKGQILPASPYQASNLDTLQHQAFAAGQSPRIVEMNHVATKTTPEDDAKTRAAIKKKMQQRRQTEPIPGMPEVEGMD
ncbi:hypothetical protein G7Y79_00042g078260 [Physcia stellaris]|nr:hypothetical protein G7Y79_00042g078260 [Physcia stellaris]